MLSKLEKHSAIYIGRPEWPMRFEDNTFKGNVGFFGGAVSINSPVFRNITAPSSVLNPNVTAFTDAEKTTNTDNFNDVNNQPVIVFAGNTFSQNQAYLSGSAIYVRYTKQHYSSAYSNPTLYNYDYETLPSSRENYSHLEEDDGAFSYIEENSINDWYEEREQQYLCGGGLLI